MKILLALYLFCSVSLFGQTWETIITPFANNQNEGVSIELYQGKQYFTGLFKGNFNLGFNTVNALNQNDIFLAKASMSGNTEWLKAIKGTGIEHISQIHCKNNQVLVSGTFSDSLFVGSDTLLCAYQRSAFIAYFDTLGNYLHAFQPDVFSADFKDFDFDSQGNLLLTGEYYQHFIYGGFSITNNSGLNFFLAKYNPFLDSILWLVHSENSSSNLGRKVVIDKQDNALVTGSYNDGTIFIDTLLNTGNANHNMFVAKIDSNGNRKWITTIEGTGEVHGYGIACDDSNNVFAIGEFEGIADIQGVVQVSNGLLDAILLKYNSNGQMIWNTSVGGVNSDEGYDVVLDANLDPIFMVQGGLNPEYLGQTLFTYGFDEPLLLKVKNSDASLIWDKRLYATQSAGTVKAKNLAIENNFIAMTGVNLTSIVFNSNPYVAANNKDFYAVILKDSLTYFLSLETELVENTNLHIYPNPSSNSIQIESNLFIDEITLYSINGKKMKRLIVNDYHKNINILDFEKGIYLLQMRSGNITNIRKIVKI